MSDLLPEAVDLLRRLGARVKARRGALGLTARELADRAGLSPRFLSDVEAGRGNIAVGRLVALARALEVSIETLVAPGAGPAGDGVEPARPSPKPHVALLGLRGAGKTTLGRRLAGVLGARFVELDERIEDTAGLSLAEIFSLHGEAYYRRLEARCVEEEVAAADPRVIALSGGVVHNRRAIAAASKRCRTVWLRAEPEDHMARVLAQGDRRPVAGRADAMQELRELLAAREPLYRRAELSVHTSGRDEDATLNALVVSLEESVGGR